MLRDGEEVLAAQGLDPTRAVANQSFLDASGLGTGEFKALQMKCLQSFSALERPPVWFPCKQNAGENFLSDNLLFKEWGSEPSPWTLRVYFRGSN